MSNPFQGMSKEDLAAITAAFGKATGQPPMPKDVDMNAFAEMFGKGANNPFADLMNGKFGG